MKRIYITFLLVFTIALFFKCKDGAPGPAGKDGAPGINEMNGTISGFTYLSDFNLNKLNDHSGIQITLTDGNSISQSTLTNSWGKFDFKDIKTGSYQLTFRKANYITTVVSTINFLGGNLPFYSPIYTLSQPSNATITSISFDTITKSVNYNNEEVLDCSFKIYAKPIASFPVRYFIGKDRNVSKNNYLYSDAATSFYYTSPTLGDLNEVNGVFVIKTSELILADSVCIVAYGSFRCPYNGGYNNDGSGLCDEQTNQDGSIEYVGLSKPSSVICKAKPQ